MTHCNADLFAAQLSGLGRLEQRLLRMAASEGERILLSPSQRKGLDEYVMQLQEDVQRRYSMGQAHVHVEMPPPVQKA